LCAGRTRRLDVVEHAELRRTGKRRAGRRFEASDAAALLVDADQHRRVRLTQRGAQCGQVLADVLREVDHAGQVGAQLRQEPRRGLRSEEPRPQHAVGETSELVRHPFTAPETSPAARRRCTMTKKIMTGIVMMVDAAMMLPQSFECSPKKDFRPIATVYCSVAPPSIVMAKMNSFHAVMKLKMLVATRPGITSGSSTERNIRHQLAPSM